MFPSIRYLNLNHSKSNHLIFAYPSSHFKARHVNMGFLTRTDGGNSSMAYGVKARLNHNLETFPSQAAASSKTISALAPNDTLWFSYVFCEGFKG